MRKLNKKQWLSVGVGLVVLTIGLTGCQARSDSSDTESEDGIVQDVQVTNSDVQGSDADNADNKNTNSSEDVASDHSASDVQIVDLSDMDDPSGEAYANIQTYLSEEYGTIETNHQSTLLDDGTECYYYEIEEYYFNDSVKNASTINETLRGIYQETETGYEADSAYYQYNSDPSEYYEGEGEPEINVPYNYYKFYDLYYVGDDYVSLVYNDVYYLGGAHPYSNLYGITIDVNTGKQVTASEVTGQSDADLLNMIKVSMGMDTDPTWEDVDYYITNTTIVYFYRQPNFYEDVQTVR